MRNTLPSRQNGIFGLEIERGRWSIWVNGNWRLTFGFENGNAYVLDYEDYH
ncbi:MAG: type II toxin-antitoxin system RelE/ParE family toxin [Usitatibacteraceae bacterium]